MDTNRWDVNGKGKEERGYDLKRNGYELNRPEMEKRGNETEWQGMDSKRVEKEMNYKE